jgi:hypothetical protein
MSQSDILIHIDEVLDDLHIHAIEQDLSMRDGVYSACVHQDRRHLMLVDFDPERLRCGDILSRVRTRGVHAEMIGL